MVTKLSIAILTTALLSFPARSLALDEIFSLYNAPQALAMGNAIIANASGYLASYYNPAGLAKMPRRRVELNALALEGVMNGTSIGQSYTVRRVATGAYINGLQSNPGSYSYTRYALQPSFSIRGFAVSLIANHELAALSDGSNIDVNSRMDYGAVVGFARNFAGNLIKVGLSGKFLIRNQLLGTFAHSDVDTDAKVNSESKEGMGFGADLGLMVTFPIKYLPSFGLVVRDIFDTSFSASNIINAAATEAPDSIARSFDVGFSINPRFSRRWQTRISVDFKHIELSSVPMTKRLHIGLQLHERARKRRFFIWLGLNQLYPTGGIGLRLPGGNLEIGTYAQDIGAGTTATSSRRFFMRYTVGFF